MVRWRVVAVAAAGLAGAVGIIGSAAAAVGTSAAGGAPAKTQPSTSVGPGAAVPTLVPPTSAWIGSTTPTTMAPITIPATLPGVPTTVAPVPSFDGAKWLAEVYAALVADPFAVLDIGERSVVVNTSAELFVVHLLGVAIAEQVDGGAEAPAYTVTADGKAVRVCRDGTCDVFSDFYAPTGLLETFSINGLPLALSASTRNVNVESFTVDSAICRARSDGVLSCALLLTSEGASTALHWDRVVFTAADGRQFGADLGSSVFSRSIADGGFGSAHVLFPGAPLEGEISIPIVSGITGTPNVATVTVTGIGAAGIGAAG